MPQPIAAGRLDLCCPAYYRIVVRASLDPARAAWFDGLDLALVEGTTVLTGVLADQSALHGLLGRVRDLGLPLVSVEWLGECPPPTEA